MKKIIILFYLMASVAYGQECLKSLSGGACIVMENNKYGVKKKDKYLIPTYFDQMADYSDKYIAAEQNGKWGLFTIKGKMLLPLEASKLNPIDASNGLVYAETNINKGLVITEKLLIPGNANRVTPFVAASSMEVTMAQYIYFMEDIKYNTPKDFTYEMAFPDTSKMAENGKKVFKRYLSLLDDPCREKFDAFKMRWNIVVKMPCEIIKDKNLGRFLDMPVTGVSYKQAQRFCNWLSDKINENYTQDLDYELIVRLPKPMEWEQMANDGLGETMKAYKCVDSLNAKQCLLFNYDFKKEFCSNTEEQIKLFGRSCVPVSSYNPDFNGMYCLFGNVAEMTTEESVAKGGSYMHKARYAKSDFQLEYHHAEPWLGFRWVVEYRMKAQ